MDTIHTCQAKVRVFFIDPANGEKRFATNSPYFSEEDMAYRYRNRPNPNMKGMAWLPQEGDEGIGFRYTRPKESPQ